MTISILEIQERLRFTMSFLFEKEGRVAYWPAMFSEGLGCSVSDVKHAMCLMRQAGYLVEWMDLRCPQGHLIYQKAVGPLRDGDFACQECGHSAVEGTMASLYFVMSEDWKTLLNSGKVR